MEINVTLQIMGQSEPSIFSVPRNLEVSSLKILVSDFIMIDDFPLEDIRLLYNQKELSENSILSDITTSDEICLQVVKNSKKPQHPPEQIFETKDLLNLRRSIISTQRTIAELGKLAGHVLKELLSSPSETSARNANDALKNLTQKLNTDYNNLLQQFNFIRSHIINENNNRLSIQPVTLEESYSFYNDLPPLIPGIEFNQEELRQINRDKVSLQHIEEPNIVNEIKSDPVFKNIIDFV